MKLNSDISAVITGGASGLGAATARLLASHGVKVAIFDMNAEKGEAVAAERVGPGQQLALQRREGHVAHGGREVQAGGRVDRCHRSCTHPICIHCYQAPQGQLSHF